MIVSIWDTLNDIAENVNDFIAKYYDNYFFWIILAAILFIIALFAISKFANK